MRYNVSIINDPDFETIMCRDFEREMERGGKMTNDIECTICKYCEGSGNCIDMPCPQCKGIGIVKKES
jgi:DnaJ-class molecular chaperone